MTDYDNTNKGMLSRNKRREKDSHPTHAGFINVDGKEYWLSAWVHVGKEGSKIAGEKYFSLAIKPKEARKDAPVAAPLPSDTDDDIPF